MKKLLVIAQPMKSWFLWELAKFYKAESGKYWDTVEILDLYEKQNYQPYLEFQNMKELNKDPNRIRFQEMIKKSDELIFVFPIWWGNMPAILKNFIDSTFEAWFAFRFQKWKSVPLKLLKWKTARVFTSCDWLKHLYNYYLCPMYLKKYLEIYILWVFWIEQKQFELYDLMRKRSREEKDEILKNLADNMRREKLSQAFNERIKNILK